MHKCSLRWQRPRRRYLSLAVVLMLIAHAPGSSAESPATRTTRKRGGGHLGAVRTQLLLLQEQIAELARTAEANHAEIVALLPTPREAVMYPPVWSRKLRADDGPRCASSRFTCVLDDEAVLDNETGLVWERSPSVFTPEPGSQSFGLLWGRTPQDPHARHYCVNRKTGGRQGWRLPYVHELTSLFEVSGPPGKQRLPQGHPFDTAAVENDNQYWTASADAISAISQELPRAFRVDIATGEVDEIPINVKRSVWCVRGAASSGLY